MRFDLHYDDNDPHNGGPGWRWWRYVVLGVVLIILVTLVIVARTV